MEELLYNTLNDQQKQAVAITDSNVRIVAGAGSGKTRALIARMEYLIKEQRVYPSRILAITFTNKAANEMKERLFSRLGEDAQGVRISTIHSFCVRMLREDASEIGYSPNFTIVDSDDQRAILLRFYKEYDFDKKAFPPSRILHYISNWKSQGLAPGEAGKNAVYKPEEMAAFLYPLYQERLDEMQALDFDDILIKARDLLRVEPVRTKWQNRLDYLHIDEFQDVDPIQYEILQSLRAPHNYLCVVGDPDQTIYTWRGASVDLFLNFDRDFAPCKTVLFTQNYRSSSSILNAANEVIARNHQRIKKDLFTNNDSGSVIFLNGSYDESEEADYVVDAIENEHDYEGRPYSDIAILYRANFSSRAFENALRRHSIPYQIYGGLRFYDRKEIRDLLAYLRLCMESEDPHFLKALDLSIERIINVPKRAIGAKTIDNLQKEASERGISLLEVLHDPRSIKGAARKKLIDFAQMVDGFKEYAKDHSVDALIDEILNKSGYKKMLEDQNEAERLENLEEFKKDFLEVDGETSQEILENYFSELALTNSAKSEDEQKHGVSLMTVHSAKGTEFESVYLVNFNEGTFPSARTLQSGDPIKNMEEERRLFYVAMTRAKKNLSITWNNGYSFATRGNAVQSRFLKEVPSQYTNRSKAVKEKEKEQALQREIESRPSKKSGKKIKLKPGQIVEHEVFGQGVVISQSDYKATIAFDHRFGVKVLQVDHPMLSYPKA